MAPTTLEAALAAIDSRLGIVAVAKPVLTEAQRKREFASHQRRVGADGIRELRRRRGWCAAVETVNPGVTQFYRYGADYRAAVAKYALSCRRRANEASAQARALEAAATMKKAA
jgi:hypothetical protein